MICFWALHASIATKIGRFLVSRSSEKFFSFPSLSFRYQVELKFFSIFDQDLIQLYRPEYAGNGNIIAPLGRARSCLTVRSVYFVSCQCPNIFLFSYFFSNTLYYLVPVLVCCSYNLHIILCVILREVYRLS